MSDRINTRGKVLKPFLLGVLTVVVVQVIGIPHALLVVYSAPSGHEADLLTSISRGRLRPTG